MAYNENIAEAVREHLVHKPDVEEKNMMGGLTFMVNGKMCVGVIKDTLMCRIDPAIHNQAVEKPGCRTMDFTKRPMSGYVQVDESVLKSPKDYEYWIGLAIDFNSKAKPAKKRKKSES
jgi:TfoX/Sxy family transcriptional regulator of competence genes